MRKELERLSDSIGRVDYDNIYQAITDLKSLMQEMLEYIDQSLPLDKSDDI